MPRCKSPPGNGWAQGIRGARRAGGQAGGQAGGPADKKTENNADDCGSTGAGPLWKGRKLGEQDGLAERAVSARRQIARERRRRQVEQQDGQADR